MASENHFWRLDDITRCMQLSHLNFHGATKAVRMTTRSQRTIDWVNPNHQNNAKLTKLRERERERERGDQGCGRALKEGEDMEKL